MDNSGRVTDTITVTNDGGIMDIDPVCDVFPAMGGKDFDDLKADIAANGLREAIWTHEGKVIDGRNRLRACTETGVEPRFREWPGDGSLVAFVVAMNLNRRHLTPSQRAAIGAEILPLFEAEAKERQRQNARATAVAKKTVVAVSNVAKLPTSKVDRPEPQPRARDQAATAAKVSGKAVQTAKKVREKAPELHEQVKAGKITVNQAARQVDRIEKVAAMEAKAKAADESPAPAGPSWEIRDRDCVAGLRALYDEGHRARLIFADPPYNIGVDYGTGADADRLEPYEYWNWCAHWISQCHRLLTPDGSLWLLINHENAAVMELLLQGRFQIAYRSGFGAEKLFGGSAMSVLTGFQDFHVRSWLTWYESFGINCANGFNRTSRRLFHAVKDPNAFVFHREAVTRASVRQRIGDSRADPGGKLWDDVWGIEPAIPRLVDNAGERVPGFPTQLPLALLRPIVACASDPGDLVVDPFCGSGTTGAACIDLGRRFVGLDLSAANVAAATTRLKAHGSGSR
jgi:16S rRNA G966 N2-methylase RsmD